MSTQTRSPFPSSERLAVLLPRPGTCLTLLQVAAAVAAQYLYRVRKTAVVSPRNTSALQPTSDAELNLVTCYPFYYVGSAPKRFIVQARLAGEVTSVQPTL